MQGMIDVLLKQKGAADKMYEEQENIEYDKKYFDPKKNKVMDMVARYNTIFGDQAKANTPDFKQFTIQPFQNFPQINMIRNNFVSWFGTKATALFC